MIAAVIIGSLELRKLSLESINHHWKVHASRHFTTRYLSTKANNLSNLSNDGGGMMLKTTINHFTQHLCTQMWKSRMLCMYCGVYKLMEMVSQCTSNWRTIHRSSVKRNSY